MTVLIIVLVFAALLVLDMVRERQRYAALVTEGGSLHQAIGEVAPEDVAGFQLPPVLSYHSGHTWVHWVSPDQAYVGLDDFARRLVGRSSKVSAPKIGTRLTQGEGAIRVKRNGDEAWLLSPLSGEVVGVNPWLKKNPDLFFSDNYGQGWLYKVRSPHLFKEFANLFNGSLARRWMEDTRDRFRHELVLATGSVIQDGGVPIEDIASGLDGEAWHTLVQDFLTPSITWNREEAV